MILERKEFLEILDPKELPVQLDQLDQKVLTQLFPGQLVLKVHKVFKSEEGDPGAPGGGVILVSDWNFAGGYSLPPDDGQIRYQPSRTLIVGGTDANGALQYGLRT